MTLCPGPQEPPRYIVRLPDVVGGLQAERSHLRVILPGAPAQSARGGEPEPEPVAVRKQPEVSARGRTTVSVDFILPGPLGLRLQPLQTSDAERVAGRCKYIELVAVNAGTQAENHAQLRPGLLLMTVGDTPVSGLSFAEVVEMLRTSSHRPLRVTFQLQAPSPVPPTPLSAVDGDNNYQPGPGISAFMHVWGGATGQDHIF